MDYTEIKTNFVKSKTGIVGLALLSTLIAVSIITIVTIPLDTYKHWNNPASWTQYPKSAQPEWINLFLVKKIPEHKILDTPKTLKLGRSEIVQKFSLNYAYDYFPGDFLLDFKTNYSGAPVLEMSVTRPDGITLKLISTSMPHSDQKMDFSDKIFSTNDSIRKNLRLQSDYFRYSIQDYTSKEIIFSKIDSHQTLKGNYEFTITALDVDTFDSKLILGGKAYGLAGTDDLRRDLAIGLLWGTPVALFIGITVAIGSVVSGLIFGVYSGYRGGKTDDAMMRFNDVIYALPALPFLIILSVTTSNNIFLMIGFLTI
ncbi:MAG: ABC transporter permease, partial [Candidatus Nitrosotenuis sp.]